MERLSLSHFRVIYLQFQEVDHKTMADSGTEPPTKTAAEIQIRNLTQQIVNTES